MIVSSINHWFSNKNETEEKFSGRLIEASERKFPLRLLMELRYSGAAGITADRVADKSFNNAKIRRAWMYNCGIFVDEPISLSLSLPLLSPSSSFFSPYPFPSLSRLHCLQAMLERRRNTSIFHSGKMSADGNFLKMTRRSPASLLPPVFVSRRVILCWISTYHRFQPPNIIDSILLVSNRQITDDDLRESNDWLMPPLYGPR